MDEAAIDTRMVKVEIDPNPQFPDTRCLDPMRVHNYNNIPVIVTYTLFYKGEGPAQYCKAEWSSQETVRLERNGQPGAWRYLGCSQHSYEGSPCVERRSWEVNIAKPADPLIEASFPNAE